jgi:beta-glucanase (GH16 family)
MKNFAAAIMLAIGAYASPFTAGELHSLKTFKYGKFVASMKPTMLHGTGSSFYLYGLDDKEEQNVFNEWNSMIIVPSHGDEQLVSRMNFNKL